MNPWIFRWCSEAVGGAQSGQGTVAAFDEFGVAVRGAALDAGNGFGHGVDGEAFFLRRGERPAVAGHDRVVQVRAAGPGIGQAYEVPTAGPSSLRSKSITPRWPSSDQSRFRSWKSPCVGPRSRPGRWAA